MRKFVLRGLAEGLVGLPFVMADDIDDIFERFSVLKSVRWKLAISGDTISGFAACDG